MDFHGNKFDASELAMCAHVPGQLKAGEAMTVTCIEGIEGRYVTIYQNHPGDLSIHELQVHGLPGWYFHYYWEQLNTGM